MEANLVKINLDLKGLGDLVRGGKAKQTEMLEKYNDVLADFSVLQTQIIEIQQENAQLAANARELREKLEMRENLVLRDEVYWLPREGKEDDGPFCALCWEDRGKLIHMKRWNRGWLCPKCNESAGEEPGDPGIAFGPRPPSDDPWAVR